MVLHHHEDVVDLMASLFFEMQTEAEPPGHGSKKAYNPNNFDDRYGKRGLHIENLLFRMSHTRCDDL